MAWDDPDLYYQPEHFGLETMVVHDRGGPWEFDVFAAWRLVEDPSVYYWATDAGCSCPSPFESYTSLESANKGTAIDVAEALQRWNGVDRGYGPSVDIAPTLERLLST